MMDVIALGELLIDFTPSGKSEAGMRIFEQNPGGAVANVLAALSKLGMRTAFIGKVGEDMHGRFLKETLEQFGVDSSGLIMAPDVFTTLAFVSLNEKGERDFSFARKPGADTCLRAEELPEALLSETKVFHFGSLSLTDEPARGATLEAVKKARAAGAVISYDPNYRAPLWKDEMTAREQMRSVLDQVDILKISDEETALITDKKEPEQAAAALVERGIPVVVVTLGGDGALVCTKQGAARVSGYACKVVDTTGAGDSFWGGFLYQVVKGGKRPAEITLEDAKAYAAFANGVASLCVEKRGGIPAMPDLAQVKERMKG